MEMKQRRLFERRRAGILLSCVTLMTFAAYSDDATPRLNEARVWTNADGVRISAKAVALDAKEVVLVCPNRAQYRYSRAKLSPDDQAYLRELDRLTRLRRPAATQQYDVVGGRYQQSSHRPRFHTGAVRASTRTPVTPGAPATAKPMSHSQLAAERIKSDYNWPHTQSIRPTYPGTKRGAGHLASEFRNNSRSFTSTAPQHPKMQEKRIREYNQGKGSLAQDAAERLAGEFKGDVAPNANTSLPERWHREHNRKSGWGDGPDGLTRLIRSLCPF